MKEKQGEYYDVWGDNIDLKELLISMLLSVIGTLGGYLIAPNEAPMPLVFGLVGGIIAFIVSSIIFKPKRRITMEERGDE